MLLDFKNAKLAAGGERFIYLKGGTRPRPKGLLVFKYGDVILAPPYWKSRRVGDEVANNSI